MSIKHVFHSIEIYFKKIAVERCFYLICMHVNDNEWNTMKIAFVARDSSVTGDNVLWMCVDFIAHIFIIKYSR